MRASLETGLKKSRVARFSEIPNAVRDPYGHERAMGKIRGRMGISLPLRGIEISEKTRSPDSPLPSVIGLRLWMDQYFEQLGCGLLESDFERRHDVMHAGKRQIVRQGAVAGHIHLVAHKLDFHLVHVQDFRELPHQRSEFLLQSRVAQPPTPPLHGGGLTLDVGQNS